MTVEIKPQALLRFSDLEYMDPTYEDVRALKEQSGMTGKQLSELVGVDQRTFRKWMSSSEKVTSKKIPYSTWRLLLIELGIV